MTAAVLPIGAVPLSPTCLAVLVAVQGLSRPTVRRVADVAGISVESTHRHLMYLRRHGFVEWEDGCAGTLRATVAVTPVGGAR